MVSARFFGREIFFLLRRSHEKGFIGLRDSFRTTAAGAVVLPHRISVDSFDVNICKCKGFPGLFMSLLFSSSGFRIFEELEAMPRMRHGRKVRQAASERQSLGKAASTGCFPPVAALLELGKTNAIAQVSEGQFGQQLAVFVHIQDEKFDS